MDFMKCITDPYDRKARLYPALLLIFPVIVTIASLTFNLQTIISFLKTLIPVIAACGFPFLLTQFVRDMGKKKEKELYESWGGIPSVVIFRYRDDKLNTVTKQRYHNSLANKCHTASVTREEEDKNASDADAVYFSWSNYLRANTRDKTKFHLLFQENINYGFRRNVFGVRFVGMIISFICFFVNALCLGKTYLNDFHFTVVQLVSVTISILLLVCWKFIFIEKWVHIPADEYAKRLVETVDVIE